MKFLKNNLNKILLLVIYIIMFYVVGDLLGEILKDFAINNNKQLLCSTIINVVVYSVFFASCIVLLKKEIITDFKILDRTNALTVFFVCLIGIVCTYLGNIFGSILTLIFGGGNQSQNQSSLEVLMTSQYGFIVAVIAVIIGPVVEELVFRKSIHSILRKAKCPTWIMLMISSLLFGFIHVLDSGDFVQVFPYIFMGLTLGGIEIFSKNIYPSIIVHIFNNAVATAVVLYTTMLEENGFYIGALYGIGIWK